MLPYLFVAIKEDFQYLVEDENTVLAAWTKLKNHFQCSTLGVRMVAQKEFYDITHDPSRLIFPYVQSVLAAKKKLTSLGCTITDTEVMDILLIRLNPSYHPVRITIFSQKSEPKLEDVKTILTASSASDNIIIKNEPVEELLAAAHVDCLKKICTVTIIMTTFRCWPMSHMKWFDWMGVLDCLDWVEAFGLLRLDRSFTCSMVGVLDLVT